MGAITVSAADVIDQLQRSHGNIKHAAGKLNTSRFNLHKYINEHPTVKAALDDIREGAKDDAELMLQDRMRTSDTLLIFYLKTQAHDRGYGDRSKSDVNATLQITDPRKMSDDELLAVIEG
jgi:dTDP-4-dehydrorhamnose reductase